MSIIQLFNKTLTTINKEDINPFVYDTSLVYEYIQESEIPEYIKKYGPENISFHKIKDGENTRFLYSIPMDLHKGDYITLTYKNYEVRAHEYDDFDYQLADEGIRECGGILVYRDGRHYGVNSRLTVEEEVTNIILKSKKLIKNAIKKYRQVAVCKINWIENSEYSIIRDLLEYVNDMLELKDIGLFVYRFLSCDVTYYIVSTEKYSEGILEYYKNLYEYGFYYSVRNDCDDYDTVSNEFYNEQEAIDYLTDKGVDPERIITVS